MRQQFNTLCCNLNDKVKSVMTNSSETYGNIGNKSHPETIVIINCVLNVPFMLTSIIGNSLVLYTIFRTPSLRSPSIILLCSLAVSDLLVGLFVQPVYIANELMKNSSLHQAITDSMAFSACGVSLLTMTAISVDRFLALHYHMRYKSLMTSLRALYITATIWFIAILLSFLSLRRKVFFFTIAACIFACILVCAVCYIKIYRVLRQHQLRIHAQQAVQRNNETIQRSVKGAINAFIYYIVMILCYMPCFVTISILAFATGSWTEAWNITDTLAFMNSSINPFLYCWRLRELRTAVIKTVKEMLRNRTEGN